MLIVLRANVILMQPNVPVHPPLEAFWNHQLDLGRCATGLLDCRLLLSIDPILWFTLMVCHGQNTNLFLHYTVQQGVRKLG